LFKKLFVWMFIKELALTSINIGDKLWEYEAPEKTREEHPMNDLMEPIKSGSSLR